MRFDPSGPLRGTLQAPGDKSLSHRAALMGAMCADPVHVTGYLDAADTRSTLDAVRRLGALVEEGAPGTLTIRGPGQRDRRGQRRHAHAAAAGLAGRPAGGVLDGGRR
jgi:3-phosphoshikimate 1-carboxyvinyltransferase